MRYLLIKKMKILNANAMSSTYTIGVPAMTAWLGATRALERKIQMCPDFQNVRLPKTGVVFHEYNLHVHPTYQMGEKQYSIIGIGKPLEAKGKGKKLTFERASRVDEPRIDLLVSLLVKVEGIDGDTENEFLKVVRDCLLTLKMAGGDIISIQEVKCLHPNEDDEKSIRRTLYELMPGNAIVSRQDLLEKEMGKEHDALQALLSFLVVHHTLDTSEEDPKWISHRKESGWLVPIAVGFKGISSIGHVKNQRDSSKPHQFVESLVTLGQFIIPYRFDTIDELMWYYDYVPEKDLYLCRNDYANGGIENG